MCTIKLFTAVSLLVAVSCFHNSPMFAGKNGAYLVGAPYKNEL